MLAGSPLEIRFRRILKGALRRVDEARVLKVNFVVVRRRNNDFHTFPEQGPERRA
jgi:hypothetical protein